MSKRIVHYTPSAPRRRRAVTGYVVWCERCGQQFIPVDAVETGDIIKHEFRFVNDDEARTSELMPCGGSGPVTVEIVGYVSSR